ncbi:MAG: hypothetical protein KatS3mg108_3578 [Isosphaeraceae bacterium]|jgi:hypothetical protein|nr:MAG: hypothetical protein KatS3mg108_3578 [Isosphaeraceae bacterium]
MTHRTLVSLIAVVVLSQATPQPAVAASLLRFRLSNQGTQSIGRLDLNIVPPGAVVPPVTGHDPETGEPIYGSPLTVLVGTSGFDATLLSVALGERPGVQALRLLFGQTQTVDSAGNVTFAPITGLDGRPKGQFDPGSVLEFALSVDSDKMSVFDLVLPEAAAGLVLQDLARDEPLAGGPTADPPPPSEPMPPVSQIPEPGPWAFWGVLSGWALWRVGRGPRRRVG